MSIWADKSKRRSLKGKLTGMHCVEHTQKSNKVLVLCTMHACSASYPILYVCMSSYNANIHKVQNSPAIFAHV
jgi:hypothetical protein